MCDDLCETVILLPKGHNPQAAALDSNTRNKQTLRSEEKKKKRTGCGCGETMHITA